MSLVGRLWGQRSSVTVGAVCMCGPRRDAGVVSARMSTAAVVGGVVGGVVTVGLLAVAGYARPPGGTALTLPSDWSAPGVRWWMVGLPALGWLAALTLVFARTMPRPRYRLAFRRALLLEALLLALGVALFLGIGPESSSGTGSEPAGDPLLKWPLPPIPPLPLPPAMVLVVLYALLVLAGLGLALWSLWEVRDRILRPRGERVRDPRYGRGRSRSAERAEALDAVARARAALLADGDLRRRVVAAYAAFEQAVLERGAARSASQTPAEYLHQALTTGVLTAGAETTTLLELFHRARFSHEPVTTDDRDRALWCLDRLRADLTGAGVRS